MVEFAFLSPAPMEIIVIAVIALLVLGPARLPEAARSLGKGMREMRDSFQGDRDDDLDDDDFDLPEDDEPPEDDGPDGLAADTPEAPEPAPDAEPAPSR